MTHNSFEDLRNNKKKTNGPLDFDSSSTKKYIEFFFWKVFAVVVLIILVVFGILGLWMQNVFNKKNYAATTHFIKQNTTKSHNNNAQDQNSSNLNINLNVLIKNSEDFKEVEIKEEKKLEKVLDEDDDWTLNEENLKELNVDELIKIKNKWSGRKDFVRGRQESASNCYRLIVSFLSVIDEKIEEKQKDAEDLR